MEALKMKNILLCAVNSQFIHSNPAVYSIKRYFDDNFTGSGIDVSIKEYTVNDVYGNILYDILAKKPDAVCFSVYIWNVETVKRLIPDILAVLPDTTVILGGPEVSFGTSQLDKAKNSCDYIIEGEGELCFLELVKSGEIFTHTDLPKRISASRLISGNEFPKIYTKESLSLFKNRIVYYESSRGCPFSCAYCLSGGDSTPVRYLPLERVFDDIDLFVSEKVPLVKFIDRTFNANKKRALEIFKKIASLPDDAVTCFHFEVGADLFDGETLFVLSSLKKGRIQIEAGIQSLNEKTLTASARTVKNEAVFKNLFEILKFKNINVHTDLIAGLPFEDIGSFKSSFNGVYSLKSHQLQLGFLKRLFGAPLCESEKEYLMVFSENPPYEILKNAWLSYDDIAELKRIEAVTERYYNSGGFVRSLDLVIEKFPSPYDFFNDFSAWCYLNGTLFAAVSKRRAYDLLYSFALPFLDEKEQLLMSDLVLFDYFSSEKSEIPPDLLKGHLTLAKPFKNSDAAVYGLMEASGYTGYGIRSFFGKSYLFDYSKKDPVSGLYPVVSVVNSLK